MNKLIQTVWLVLLGAAGTPVLAAGQSTDPQTPTTPDAAPAAAKPATERGAAVKPGSP
jgi:hypothetical protein